ncbi:meiosis inhibitor protein 1 [Latimeria chalumnae]|uniref:meiosis inhibitor protein 1 n=1 Tax=Latimeria chalumnae TaxID=7897 RepID=UPI00313A9E30
MCEVDVVYERAHYRHDPKWMLQPRRAGEGPLGLLHGLTEPQRLCLACVIEMAEESSLSVVRKKHALFSLKSSLQRFPSAVVELLTQDGRVCAHFIGILIGMLQSLEDVATLDLVVELLVQLMAELKSDQFVCCVLDGCCKQLSEKVSMGGSLPVFTLLGKLVDTIPPLTETLILEYGLLKQLLKYSQFVAVLMSVSLREGSTESSAAAQGGKPLPLLLKKLLLSREETLQIASAQCVAAVLVHSPAQYAPALVQADIPEFLFECLSSSNEVLVWSVYSCLLLLTEEKLLFSKCHTVYGIESLVRSLKETLRSHSAEVQKQGLLLLAEILKRQPVGIKLFANPAMCREVIAALLEGVESATLEVAIESVNTSAVFLRKEHLSPPVQYRDLQKLLEVVLKRSDNLTLPPSSRRAVGPPGGRDQNRSVSRQAQFLLSTLQTFNNACRLAVECQSDACMQENAFTAPGSEGGDTLERFSEFLLQACDSLCIPTVMRQHEISPNLAVMEIFFLILSAQFSVLPSMMHQFSTKLASSSFIRLVLELKCAFCTGHRNPKLNAACSDFLDRLCCTLYVTLDPPGDPQHELPAVSLMLKKTLSQLNYSPSDSLALLSETPDTLEGEEALRSNQHALIFLFFMAYAHQDRLVHETQLLPAVCCFVCSAVDHGDPLPPPFILRAVVCLLSLSQEKCDALDTATLDALSILLKSVPDFSLVYTHHPLLLNFFFRYPELSDQFGHRILQAWFCWAGSKLAGDGEAGAKNSDPSEPRSDISGDSQILLQVIEVNPNVVLLLLGIVCTEGVETARRALSVLKLFLKNQEGDLPASDLLRPRLLQILQRFMIDSQSAALSADRNLPLVLDLLFLIQLREGESREMDSTDFKLLYHVSNLSGKCEPSNADILQPAFNFMYCSLQQTTSHNQSRVVSMLLSNVALMELLENLLEETWAATLPCRPQPEAVLCSAWLLTASLLHAQRNHSSEVPRKVNIKFDELLKAVSFMKKASSLLLASLLHFLSLLLRRGLASPLIAVVYDSVRTIPLQEQDAALYPLSARDVSALLVSLQNLLVQRDDLLLHAASGCMETLMHYLHQKHEDTARHVASQPWNRFLLFTLLSSGESSCLHPAVLRLLALFLKTEGSNVVSQCDVSYVLQRAAKLQLEELSDVKSQALHTFLTNLVKRRDLLQQEDMHIADALIENLHWNPKKSPVTHKRILCLCGVAVCLSNIQQWSQKAEEN